MSSPKSFIYAKHKLLTSRCTGACPSLCMTKIWFLSNSTQRCIFSHRIIETLVIILENAISVNKPILDSGTCSLSRISTHTPKVTIKINGCVISRNVMNENFFCTYLANNNYFPSLRLSWTVTVQDKLLSSRGNS